MRRALRTRQSFIRSRHAAKPRPLLRALSPKYVCVAARTVHDAQELFLLHAPSDGNSIRLFPASIGLRFFEFADVSWKFSGRKRQKRNGFGNAFRSKRWRWAHRSPPHK